MIAAIPTTEHTLAQVRLDDITDWIDAHGCAHLIKDICDLHRQPRIVFASCEAMARALDGTGICVRVSTYEGQPFWQASDAGLELVATGEAML